MKNHSHILHEIPDYLSGRLGEKSREEVEEHLKACSQCRSEFDELRFAAEAASGVKLPEPSEDYWASILQRVRIRLAGLPGSSVGVLDRRAVPWVERLLTPLESGLIPVISRLAPASALVLAAILVVHSLRMKSDRTSEQLTGGNLEALVESLENEDLASLMEPSVVPHSLITITSTASSVESKMLGELLAEGLPTYAEPVDVFGITTTFDGLSDQELETILEKLVAKLD